MTDIRAFQGIRYNQNKVRLNDVTAPPYDIISLDMQELLYQKSPYNIVRLDYGLTFDADNGGDNRYIRAAHEFTRWQKEDVLTRDAEPAAYVYEQEFIRDGAPVKITGFVCLVRLTEFGEDVLPHEKTLAGPKVDRRRLLETCRANFSQVFALYSDRSGTITEIIHRPTSGTPEMEAVDEDGVVHRMWRLADKKAVDTIVATMRDRRLLIADGHHRYETSLNFMKDSRAAGDPSDACNYIMMFLADMAHEDLLILPTHRLVRSMDFDLEHFLRAAGPAFKAEKKPWVPRSAADASRDKEVRFGLYSGGRMFCLSADRARLADSLVVPRSEAWKRLDTVLLQETLLKPRLGIDGGGKELGFVKDAKTAIKRVDSKQADLAVLLEPMLIDTVEEVAEAGEIMPQKSTYFYPKPRTGLVVYGLD